MSANGIAQGVDAAIGDMRRNMTDKYQFQFWPTTSGGVAVTSLAPSVLDYRRRDGEILAKLLYFATDALGD